MNNNKIALPCKVLGGVFGLLLAVASVAARPVADTLEQPAVASALAERSALNAAALAGERLVVAGVRGNILYSDDQGDRWQAASVPVSTSLTGLCFADRNNGWAVGHRGVILATRDGGATWVRQFDGLRAAEAILQARQGSEFEAEAQRLVKEGADKPFLAVHCMGDGQALASGAYGLAFATRDGGQHWRPVMALLDGSDARHLNAVQALDNQLYLAGEQGTLLRIDRDLSHLTRFEMPYDGSFFGVQATQDQSLLVFGLRGNALRSADRGASWQAVSMPTHKSLTAAALLRDGAILLADESGQGWISRDDGRSFRPVSPEQRFPLIALLATADGGSLAVGVRGMTRFTPSALR